MALVDEQIEFAVKHPWPPGWPRDMITRFLGGLIASPAQIFDSLEQGKRLCLAVMADQISNPGRNATLEFLGLSPEGDRKAMLAKVLAWAPAHVPPSLAGFTVPLPEEWAEELCARYDLQPYYRTFGMLHDSPGTTPPPQPGLCSIVTDRDEEELYGVLKRSFAENLDTNIVPFEEWQAARRAPSRSKTWGVWKDKELVSFLNLQVPKAIAFAEIRTVGTLAEHRGKGYAKALIQRALGYVAQLEIPRCALTVAAHNDGALSLYTKLGFKEVERQSNFVWRR